MLTRLRNEEGGFGLIELLMSMTVLNIGILALVAAFNSGAIALQRASKLSTATALADQQMELYRAIRYDAIGLTQTSVDGAPANYASDSAIGGNTTQLVRVATCAAPADAQNACVASRNATGPDGRPYRVDTYVISQAPTGAARAVKIVTIVVRDAQNLSGSLYRAQSTFDLSTGT